MTVAPISAGQLDQRVTLQRPSQSVDSLGQRVDAWQDVATVWAQVQPLRGREWFAAGQTQSAADVRVVIRWRDDVDESWRVLWRGKALSVVAPPIDVDGARVRLELMCRGGVVGEA